MLGVEKDIKVHILDEPPAGERVVRVSVPGESEQQRVGSGGEGDREAHLREPVQPKKHPPLDRDNEEAGAGEHRAAAGRLPDQQQHVHRD